MAAIGLECDRLTVAGRDSARMVHRVAGCMSHATVLSVAWQCCCEIFRKRARLGVPLQVLLSQARAASLQPSPCGPFGREPALKETILRYPGLASLPARVSSLHSRRECSPLENSGLL